MPQKIVSTTWECKLCDHEYAAKRLAVGCERQGIIPPRFRMGQMVRESHANGDWSSAMVCQVWTDDLYPFVHDGTLTYIICLEKPWAKGHFLRTSTADNLQTSDSGSAKDHRNVRNWNEFWKLFGRDNLAARRAVRRFIRQRKVRLPAAGEPKFC